ncbi:hypothetical protein A2130_00085 [Candidatus Woesebacteria bacterium GWC2_33_12]|uniref:Uncharacterized protein n=1 Tax=Candidatus Woesebacteria bacterium GW2011_GWB1_33_22 TaxID=1618566 RepID=A0A0G0CN16_9BACT|nr:MAG: hypothetical protein UR29_C0010G0008 [Candidatus Woesebacteria bacterium GW2011_GWC2_33_12]KKP42033.1 MAG: hypothetical protein UR33_C0006G0017 [Candidatus Woesebacteria bacterium GW2011_GWA2_33_20]KKP44817.1 MAG: hypothetical protein UR35_C0006G0052 [Candidatus Woesebacteria bacterium GW2011_GWB1_33_22]KKP46636.1 MAG: hypothetical protein UR37_C0006G0086 [Microgenomates group bacterium GW2011_GWC1_33_28]KKP50549.1 MAG: hypothetical protein UR41_C0006G0052 [Candidatus Woesebacteria bact
MDQNLPESTTTNLQSQSTKSNSLLIALLSILLLLSCIIAGFFVYQTQNLVKEITKLRNSASTNSPTPWIQPESTLVDFKYPLSDSDGYMPVMYTMRIPQNYNLYGPMTCSNVRVKWMNLVFGRQFKNGSTAEIDIYFTEFRNNIKQTLENFISEFSDPCPPEIKKFTYSNTDKIIINDINAYKIILNEYTYNFLKSPKTNQIYVMKYKNDVDKTTELFDQILSTFKFTGSEPVSCTKEAKLCPDGTSVGRTGPNCEFAPCPN